MKYEYKIENGKLFKREIPSMRSVGNCYYCNKPVFAGEGQMIKYKVLITPSGRHEYPTHKKCRQRAKKG